MNTLKPTRALVSVSDKAQLDGLVPALLRNKIEVISTGGTADYLRTLGVPLTPIQAVTGNPEAFGGRMKSISFQVSSALLFRRDHEQDLREARELNIRSIDLVICNLYPFKKVAAQDGASVDELIENIDVGGPGMIRAAAKNMAWVTVVTDPADYGRLAEALDGAGVTLELRRELGLKAFALTAQYDLAIATRLAREFGAEFPEVFSSETKALRYGENPHQAAKLFVLPNQTGTTSLADAPVLQGKEISYNNYLDADQAFKCVSELAREFPELQHCVIVKHGIPCGVASAKDQLAALTTAWACDAMSAFGGIIAFSKEVSAEAAQWLAKNFIEVVLAPGYADAAREAFATKKNIRLVQVPLKVADAREWTVRSINGGVLWQSEDENLTTALTVPTERKFTDAKTAVMRFGLAVGKYLKSNCLLLVDERDGAFSILASGVGQPNRLECLSLLLGPRLRARNVDPAGAVLVSDAFFPFRDSIDAAKEWGIDHVVQPGGSIKDAEVIAACNELNIAMALTGERHFRH
jgi:phosphoribosylaminoimidazolecarboxamide formyltransferase/IMP cyclohydrolase